MFDTMIKYFKQTNLGCYMLGLVIIDRSLGVTTEEFIAGIKLLSKIGTGLKCLK